MTSTTSEQSDRAGTTPCIECGDPVDPVGAGRFVMHPSHCQACSRKRAGEQANAARRGRVAKLFEASNIPERYRRFRLEQRPVARCEGESWAAFVQRVHSEPTAIGVTRDNAAALRASRDWLPEHGSIYFEGNVGGGKSMLACAIACKFLRLEQSAVYITEGELWQDVRTDAKRLVRLAQTAGILIWDDWGTTGTVHADESGKPGIPNPKDWQRELVEDVISRRYNASLPTLFTANVPLEQATQQWSARVGSRIAEMVGSRKVALVDHDWRTGAAFGGATP